MTKVLCKHICQIIFTVYKIDLDVTSSYDVMNIMISDVNMFRSFFRYQIRCNED